MHRSYYRQMNRLSDTSKAECMRRIVEKYNEPKFCDALFFVGQDEIPICTIGSILAIQSEYFNKLLYNSNFDQDKKENGKHVDSCYDHISKIFYEPDVTKDAFNYIVQFCHQLHDSLSITSNNAVGLLYASNKYLLRAISEECKHFLESDQVSKDNILGIICDLRKFGLASDDIGKVIEEKLSAIIQNGCESLIDSEQFLQLPHDIISKYFVKNEDCDVKEEVLFEKCVEYCKIQTTKLNSRINVQNNGDSAINIDVNDVKTDETLMQHDRDDSGTKMYDNWQSMMRSLFLFDIRIPIMSGVYITETLAGLKLLTNQEMIDVLSQMVNRSSTKEASKFIGTHRKSTNNDSNKNNQSQDEYLEYTLRMSSTYDELENTYESLISDDAKRGAGTKSGGAS